MAAKFDSTKEGLSSLLDDIHAGRMALPDFQRDWRWDDDHVTSLLASVAQGFPIGTIMTLATGNADVRFKTRPIAGAPELSRNPRSLVLDGQQRLTSLYQVLRSGGPVATSDKRKKPIDRWYYLNVDVALDPAYEFEDAIESIDLSKRRVAFGGEVVLDLTSQEAEWRARMFPLSILFDVGQMNDWFMGFAMTLGSEPLAEWKEVWKAFQEKVAKSFYDYQIPIIKLGEETPKEAVCQVFEKVNTGGVPLDVFELVTASFAADEFDLRADWQLRRQAFAANPYLKEVLGAVMSTDFLQAVSLVVSWSRREEQRAAGHEAERLPAVSCKRKDILQLSHEEYSAWAELVAAGFIEAAQLLHAQRLLTARDLPYRTQLVPMAAVYALLGSAGRTDTVHQKIARWYWCGVFGELYGGATETRFARDVQELVAWARGSEVEPTTIRDSNFAASRLLTLRTRNSAAYKGVHALLMRDGCLDFREGKPIDLQTFVEGAIDIHHIFPQDYYRKQGIPDEKGNSIINKTALSARTNRIIGGASPSVYLGLLERDTKLDSGRLDDLLRSHAIDPSALRTDDFDAFFQARATALIDRIEKATGRPIQRDLDDLDIDISEFLADYEGAQAD